MRENAILWLLGTFIETVESLVIIKENSLTSAAFIGILKQKKLRARGQAMPDIGIIPGIDWDVMGVG